MTECTNIKHLNSYNIILASASPRRRQLLTELGLIFAAVQNGNDDESFPEGLDGAEAALYLAAKKSHSFTGQLDERTILITADTIVWLDGKVLPKPADREEAIQMIRHLSGTCHKVYTAVTIRSLNTERSFCSSTDVYFDELTDEEILYYVDNFKPLDKAGAYGIQEWIGLTGVKRIDGSYFNVMGLPVQELYRNLTGFVNEMEGYK